MARNRRVVVIGAGLAGLRAGWELARAGHLVTVLERKAAAGGRAGSAPDPETGEPVDTGQHALLGCYSETLAWCDALGTRDRFRFQPRLEVRHLAVNGPGTVFRAVAAPRPFNLLLGLRALAPGERGGGAAALIRGCLPVVARDDLTVTAWAERIGLSRAVRTGLIEPLALAALNERPEVASAQPLGAVLRRLAAAGNRGAAVGFATAGLGDTYVPAASRVIAAAGGEVRGGAWTAEIVAREGRVVGVRLTGGEAIEADAVVAAVPPWDLAPLVARVPELSGLAARLSGFEPSPIVTVHLWLDRSVHPEWFSGLEAGVFDWVFNRSAIVGGTPDGREHLCLVKSGARDLLGVKPDGLAERALEELRRYVPAARGADAVRSRVVWEPRATVSLTPGTHVLRPHPGMALPGLALAGDWTRTGLPATIEGAVKSGRMAARALLASFR